MSRGSRDDVRIITQGYIDAYYEGESIASIAARIGKDPSTINKAIKRDREANGPRERLSKPHDPRLLANKKALSSRHAAIGLKISRYMATNDLKPTAFGMLVSASAIVVRNMELGAHDFTLSQLLRLAVVLDMSFEQLTVEGASVFQQSNKPKGD